jgi:uncharacterized protein YqcC (DUF446 family)
MYPYAEAGQKIDELETELKRLGRWSDQPLPPEAFENMGPFGSNTMAFEQWLQFVLAPRVRDIIASQGQFPSSSQVGVYAIRELDSAPDAEKLVALLCEFDALFEHSNNDDIS